MNVSLLIILYFFNIQGKVIFQILFLPLMKMDKMLHKNVYVDVDLHAYAFIFNEIYSDRNGTEISYF